MLQGCSFANPCCAASFEARAKFIASTQRSCQDLLLVATQFITRSEKRKAEQRNPTQRKPKSGELKKERASAENNSLFADGNRSCDRKARLLLRAAELADQRSALQATAHLALTEAATRASQRATQLLLCLLTASCAQQTRALATCLRLATRVSATFYLSSANKATTKWCASKDATQRLVQ